MSHQGAKTPNNLQCHHRQWSHRSLNEGNRPTQNACPPSMSRPVLPGSDLLAVNPAANKQRLVLLGRTGAGKSATGNSILGGNNFDAELSMGSVTKECKRECGTVEGRELVLVDTPGFFDTDLTAEELQQEVKRCLTLCSPGPHAFLLVVPIERFTEEQQRTIEMILEMFREDISRHTILIFSHADRLRRESIERFVSRQNQKVQDLVERFGRRFVAFDNTNPTNRDQVRRLLQKVDELLVLNENRHFTNKVTVTMQKAQKIVEEIQNEQRLVLLGRTGAGKSATGNTILGGNNFDAELSMGSVTKKCKRECGTVEGRELVLVDTPGFFDTDLTAEQLQQEVIYCLALSSPGPHAFLLVVPIERFTEEQQRTVEMILEMFHEDISRHTILIFTHADRLRGESIESFILKQNRKIQDLVKRFGRRFVAFDNTNPANRDQVRRLLQKVDELLVLNENRHFTNEVTEAMQKAQKIVEERIQAETAERARKIKEEVRKMADVRWRAFLSDMNEERQETERRRKRIQRRIDQIQEDIKKEEQNVEPIPERLKRYSMSLQTELENMGRLEERRMEDERERKEQEERERNDLDIWIQEEEQRRLDEEKPKNLFSPEHIKIVTMLSMFILGIGATFAPALLAFLFPAAPVAPAGFAAGILTRLLAAEGWGFVWVAAGVAKAAVLTRCSIQ